MTPDLHPEELFDKAAQGTLTPAEQATLDAHLARCPVCRFERQAAQDFAAMPLPNLDVDHLVSNALTARASANVRTRGPRRAGMLLAAALTLTAMGSLAAVGQVTGVLPKLVQALTAPAPEVAPPAPPRVSRAAPAPLESVVVDEAPPPLPELVETSVPEAAQPDVAPSRPVRRASPVPREEVADTPPIPDTRPPPPPPPSAAELFATANRARLAGDRAEAIAAYRLVLQAWPSSVEAMQTRATLGRLLLDEGNPSGAIEQLDAYLVDGGAPLREEVMSARAQAFMRLGREAEEAQAWRALLETYPDSIHAARAHARLKALGASP